MTRTVMLLLLLGALAACDGSTGKDNPFEPDAEETGNDTAAGGDGDDDANAIDGDRTLPPGTANPSPNTEIVRQEAINDDGGGYAENITYNNDEGQDEFSVDNLAFDGDNTYVRGGTAGSSQAVGQLKSFAVYESDIVTTDPLTNNQIGTFDYRAIYGRSTSGQTEFAIVRTGSYVDYGFGGFVYQRNGTDAAGNANRLVLPDDGDAEYLGDYAAVRVFEGRTGLEYVEGDARVIVDFKDFNENRSGVALFVVNRRLFDSNGNDITAQFLDALETNNGGGLTGNTGATLIRETDANGNLILPDIRPVISPNIADGNGELTGEVRTRATYSDGTSADGFSGSYFAVMSGENAEEIVGVVVMTREDPRVTGNSIQETGGFIVYRQ